MSRFLHSLKSLGPCISQLLRARSHLTAGGGLAIGVEMADDILKLAQLAPASTGKKQLWRPSRNDKGITLIAGGSEVRPADVEPGSAAWQRWAIEALRALTANNNFRARHVNAAMPPTDLFIEPIKMANPDSQSDLTGTLLSQIKQKLPFDSDNVILKHIPMEEDNILVTAVEREKVDRHLAIYEKAQLTIKSISIWPLALINTYVHFFGRRKTDVEAVVMLVSIDRNSTNVVICRHRNLLFARSIPIGADQLEAACEAIQTLTGELAGCRRYFDSMYKKAQIERLIFLSSKSVNGNMCAEIAKQLEIPAQMGDCLAAITFANPSEPAIDRRGCRDNWAIAFGLSLPTEAARPA